ncbi:MAG TPA: hypothetical protein DCY72_01670, partial [Ruminococcaceae bacterium]|nr:hypothetical protein [Oscillospiraceae bacterium]
PTTAPEPTEAVGGEGYYVVGSMSDWTVSAANKLSKNDAAETDEYTISMDLTTTSEFKVVYSEDGVTAKDWFPDGSDNNYGLNGEIEADGKYDIYFRPKYDGGDDWFYNVIYVTIHADQPTEPPVVIYGDADGDGVVTVKDVTLIQRYLIHTSELGVAEEVCDVDGDGFITAKDTTFLQRYITHLPIPENVHIGKQ